MEYLSDNLHQTHTQVFLHYQGKWSAAPDNYLELQFGNPNFDELESCVKWFINLFTDYLKSVLKENYEETHLFVKEYTCTFQVDTRDVFGDGGDNLSNCQPQCRFVGQVTDMRRGVVYVRLNNGVNAIAHTCYDARMPGRKDTVSFAVTRLDEAHGIAIGIITRIIKQNL